MANRVSWEMKSGAGRGNPEPYAQKEIEHPLKVYLTLSKLQGAFFFVADNKQKATPFHDAHLPGETIKTRVRSYEPKEDHQLRLIFFAGQYLTQRVPAQAEYDWYAKEYRLFQENRR